MLYDFIVDVSFCKWPRGGFGLTPTLILPRQRLCAFASPAAARHWNPCLSLALLHDRHCGPSADVA